MGALVRAKDWTATPAGPPQDWPAALKTAVALCLNSPAPLMVWPGRRIDELVQIYNDPCREMLGDRHPWALGRRASEIWPEIWAGIRTTLGTVLEGEAVRRENEHLVVNRNGYPEPVWFTHAHSPIRTEDGRIVGVLTVMAETTRDMRNAQRLAFEAQFAEELRGVDDPSEVLRVATRLLGQHLGADVCGFGEIDPRKKRVVIEHGWSVNAVPGLAGSVRLDKIPREILDACRAGRLVKLANAETLAEMTLARGDMAVAIIAPLLWEGEFVASLHVHSQRPRLWTEDDEATVRFVAERTWTALEGSRAKRELVESQARLALATRASGLGIWDARVDGEVILSPRAREIWGFEPEARVTLVDMVERVLPEDRAEAGEPTFPVGRPVREGPFEYRVRRPDGEVRWVRAHVQPIYEMRDGQSVLVRGVGTMEDVTDERLTQVALRDSEARLRLALDAGRMAVWSVDADGRLDPSPEFNRLWGLAPDSTPTMSELRAHLYPGDFEHVLRVGQDAVKRGERHFECEFRHICGDEVCWQMMRSELLRDESGAMRGAVGVVFDITARKQAEEQRRKVELELRNSESRLRIAQVAGQIGTFEFLPKQNRMLVSEAFCRLWGVPIRPVYSVPDLLKQIHPEDLAQLQASPRFTDQNLDYREYRIRRLDTGEERWMVRRGQVMRDDDGRKRYLGVSYDVTDRKRAELALQALNETLEAEVTERTAQRDRMWRLSAEIMLVGDFSGRIHAVNPAWEKVLGWRLEEIQARPIIDFIHPDDHESTRREMGKLARGQTTLNFENRCLHRNGSYRRLAWAAVPEGGFVHALARDVTEERAAAETLRRTEEALRQAQKMEAVGQLTGGIAHDFNNMLAIVIGSLDLAQRRLERSQDAARYLDHAREGALRAASLTQRLLAFSRRQPLSPKVLDLNRLVGDMTELLRRTLGETVTLETRLTDPLWPVYADPNQMESALINLAVNARDAMPEGGQLLLETANVRLEEALGHEPLDPTTSEFVMIAVSDRGAGMTPEVLERVFDPFFTTKPVGKGTGLGLSMVYGFVHQSGGHVAISSELGAGTTVKIYLPRRLETVEDDAAGGRGAAPDSSGSEVVLVAEDEAQVRQMSVEALKELGYAVHEAASGEEALRVLDTLDRLDLLFTDIVMPGMNGRQLAEAVLARSPHVKVLYTTGYARETATRDGAPDGGAEFLPKPFSIGDLAAKVRAVLDH
jgi:PAS domain S-box-containing protein